jgi:hypothetical protein
MVLKDNENEFRNLCPTESVLHSQQIVDDQYLASVNITRDQIADVLDAICTKSDEYYEHIFATENECSGMTTHGGGLVYRNPLGHFYVQHEREMYIVDSCVPECNSDVNICLSAQLVAMFKDDQLLFKINGMSGHMVREHGFGPFKEFEELEDCGRVDPKAVVEGLGMKSGIDYRAKVVTNHHTSKIPDLCYTSTYTVLPYLD